MNKLPTDPRFPVTSFDKSYLDNLNVRLYEVYRNIVYLLNSVAAQEIEGAVNAQTAAPTTGAFSRGDFVRNSAPSELGATGSKYVIHGWICVVSGTPGTWTQCRYLTGN